jgi:hypothetical protein
MKLISLALLTATVGTWPVAQAGLIFQFDYSYDANNFFSAAQKSALESAASYLETRIEDNLLAIPATASSGQTWKPVYRNPATGVLVDYANMAAISVPAQTLLIYVGSRSIGGGTLAQATSATSVTALQGPSGDPWRTTVLGRGQTGVDIYPTVAPNTSTDFGPWGGSIAFDASSSWYFDADVSTTEVPSGQFDFFSVAVHELGHLLGIGLASSWTRQVSGTTFTGAASVAANGGVAPPLQTDGGHWASNTASELPNSITPQEAALDPDITAGTRKWFTDLDWAALEDIGWQVTPVPEPAEVTLFAGVGLGVFGWIRRRRQAAARAVRTK